MSDVRHRDDIQGDECRGCGRPTVYCDERGPVHVCCKLNERVRPGQECVCEAGPVEVAHSFGLCRICGGISYFADSVGPVHSCCRMNLLENPGKPCQSCASSRAAAQRFMRSR